MKFYKCLLSLLSFQHYLYCILAHSEIETKSSNVTQGIYRSRIVGGMPAAAEKYPHNALIHRLTFKAFCGGSIIAKSWILTAAQCKSPGMVIYVGTNWLLGGERYKAKTTYTHPQYNYGPGAPRFDFMLIELTEILVFSQFVKPITLSWSMLSIGTGKIGYLPGFGIPYEQYQGMYYILREISLPIIDFEKCKEIFSSGGNYLGKDYYFPSQVIKDTDQFCAGYQEGGRSMCDGDAGSGLMVDGVLVGIASHSVGCARPNSPNVFAAVPAARDWICSVAGV